MEPANPTEMWFAQSQPQPAVQNWVLKGGFEAERQLNNLHSTQYISVERRYWMHCNVFKNHLNWLNIKHAADNKQQLKNYPQDTEAIEACQATAKLSNQFLSQAVNDTLFPGSWGKNGNMPCIKI